MTESGHGTKAVTMIASGRWFATIACGLLLAGCSTYEHHLTGIRQAYYRNDLVGAIDLIERRMDLERGDADVLRLETAVIKLSQGNPQEAEEILRQVRDRFERLESDAAGQLLSGITDDQRRAYSGEDYERVLVRAFLALSNLLDDGQDAEAYTLQMIDAQERIIQAGRGSSGRPDENPKATYPRVALAPYLCGMLRESTHRDFDDAGRCYASVVSWQPSFTAGAADLERARHGRHSAPGCGVLYVFALTGRGPYKQEVLEVPSTAALLIAGEIVSHVADQTLPPNIAPVKVPRVVARPNAIQAVSVSIDGGSVGTTATVTDVTDLAVRQAEAVFPQVVARAVARRVLKKGMLYGAKELAEISKGSLASLAVDLAGVAWEATESADTRCWGLLPDKIQVLRVELPAGEHVVELEPVVAGRAVSHHAARQSLSIADGRNTYLMASFPDDRLVGRVLVNSPH
jgi:hypothetical protein